MICSAAPRQNSTPRPAGPLVENATFRKRKWELRCDIEAVDWFLGRFLVLQGHVAQAGLGDDPWHDLPVAQLTRAKSSPGFSEECANAWRDFGQVPGMHLWWGGSREVQDGAGHRGAADASFHAGLVA